jgi:hypothetical protein
LGNIDLNTDKVSLKVKLFLLTSECSHIIDITGRSEDIKKTMMTSRTADDAMHTCYRKQVVENGCIMGA